MIKVLNSWEEVEKAIDTLRNKGFGLHGDPVKNWDLVQIAEVLEAYGDDIRVLDMGCGGTRCAVLRFLYAKGLENCFGIDLSISLEDKLAQIYLMVKKRTLKIPFRLIKGDLTKTQLPCKSFDVIICLSVIEHDVDPEAFFKETSRLLNSGGTLYLSTDYWEPKTVTSNKAKPLGLNWNIFSKEEILDLIKVAKRHDFEIETEKIPLTMEKVVHWNRKDYTAISLILTKKAHSMSTLSND